MTGALVVEALQLPGFDNGPTWQRRDRGDGAARELADRHYSRRTPGTQVGPPGRVLVFVTPCERAAWITHYPAFALDGLDAFRCSLFRNEGAGLSSSLIVDAMHLTARLWPDDAPADGWVTYVDPPSLRSTNPGYCFKVAGWTLDRQWQARVRMRHQLRLRAALPCPDP